MVVKVTRKILIEPDQYIGAVKYKNVWRLYYALLDMWVLRYEDYDGPYQPKESEWRYGIVNVDENNAGEYIETLSPNEISPEEIPYTYRSNNEAQEPLSFVINFDSFVFVNGWNDMLPVHTWAPSHWSRWRDSPYKYIPEKYRKLW